MIARRWTGAFHTTDADQYADYIRETGFREYGERPATAAPGCCVATTMG
jgi:hypothetical protein